MQVFWVSGPVGKIRSFNLSYKTAVIGCLIAAVTLVAAGVALQFFGFRFALEYDPQIARQLGSLHTAGELENLNAIYRTRLQELEDGQQVMARKIQELEASNEKLINTLVPKTVITSRPQPSAQGGAYFPKSGGPISEERSVLVAIDRLQKLTFARNKFLTDEIHAWQSNIQWLENLPLGIPVAQDHVYISSGFGERIDPILKTHSFHPGVDIQLPLQTPIIASGAGVVVAATRDPEYGNMLLIRHQNGFMSRYAHASELLVTEGTSVTRGQLIARSGSSGRSTGPHLHFEVIQNNQPVDPTQYIIAIANHQPPSSH